MDRQKKNIILHNTYDAINFISDSSRSNNKIKPRDREFHGQRLLRQFENVWKTNEQQKAMFATIKERQGTYIEFKGASNCDLLIKSLENTSQGIELLNVRSITQADNEIVECATVFIPDGKEHYFNDQIQDYLDQEKKTKNGNPMYKKLIESIETIQLAVISSFWIGNEKHIPDQIPVWCEFWLSQGFFNSKKFYKDNIVAGFFEYCESLGIAHKDTCINFPENSIVLAKVNRSQIQELINTCGYISEIRRAPELARFYVKMNAGEAKDWFLDLKERLILSTNSYVCILDTGVNRSHPLLSDILDTENIQTVNTSWGVDDRDGHGTKMAGICEYYDLETLLSGSQTIRINHTLESVKLLSHNGMDNNPDLYGNITANASSLAEISNPQVKRVYCMAVTADKYVTKDGTPSSWSAALDSIIAGVDDGIKKIFVVSAGNVETEELERFQYPEANIQTSVQDPGQSWNAITVGGYSDKIQIDTKLFSGWSPVADVGQLCPFSSTSIFWDSQKWPVKPEILMNGGNSITDGQNYDSCDDVSLLTTSRDIIVSPMTTINATSAATAQAAYMAAELMSAYPELWEESIRALMIHSAEWSDKMIAQFCKDRKKKGGIRALLRTCGYGIADLQRAKNSADNSVNMIIQAELQPYCKEDGRYTMKEMHLHKLPWPSELLRELGNTEVTMKVTLSYYIEPAPEQKGWNNRYRYSSSALRFEVINKNQSKEDFLKRINAAQREADKKDKGDGDAGSERWFLGKDNRDVGSIHSDYLKEQAVNLALCNYIAVYPVIGWWRERHNLNRYNSKIRYSLIVSITTPNEEVDFYTPIETMISQSISI